MTSVLVVSERYHPYGGAELATHFILNLLKNEGFDITVVTGAKNIEKTNGVKYVYAPILNAPSKVNLWINELRLTSANWLNKLIMQSDVVYIPRIAYPLIPLAKRYGKKIVVHLHDYHPIAYCSVVFCSEEHNHSLFCDVKKTLHFEMLENESVYKALLSPFFALVIKLTNLWITKADKIICVSHRQREIIQSIVPQLADKLEVVYNPLPEISKIDKRLRKPAFMYLGGESYVKGSHVLLSASQELLRRGFSAKFLLTKGFKDTTRLLIGRLNQKFHGSYILLGYLKNEDVLKLHSISYALLFPSICEEPWPYAVLEAMVCGTIPIASRVGGVPEMVKGSFAEKMLFEPGNVRQFMDKMELLLAMSNEQIIDAGFNIRETALMKFGSEATKKRIREIFLS
jgi:glycosyltransferase involved in cell wall biosynthesis